MPRGQVKAAKCAGQVKAARVRQVSRPGAKCQVDESRLPSTPDKSRLQECTKVSSVKRLPSAPSVKAGGQVSNGCVRRTCQGCKSAPKCQVSRGCRVRQVSRPGAKCQVDMSGGPVKAARVRQVSRPGAKCQGEEEKTTKKEKENKRKL